MDDLVASSTRWTDGSFFFVHDISFQDPEETPMVGLVFFDSTHHVTHKQKDGIVRPVVTYSMLDSTLPVGKPHVLALSAVKVATWYEGDVTIALGTSVDVPDIVVVAQLGRILAMFRFFHKTYSDFRQAVTKGRERKDPLRFGLLQHKCKQVFSAILKHVHPVKEELHWALAPTPRLDVSGVKNHYYVLASQLIASVTSKHLTPWAAVVFKDRVVCHRMPWALLNHALVFSHRATSSTHGQLHRKQLTAIVRKLVPYLEEKRRFREHFDAYYDVVYPEAVAGELIVTALQKLGFAETRDEGKELCQQMMKYGLMFHVEHNAVFSDSTMVMYRFPSSVAGPSAPQHARRPPHVVGRGPPLASSGGVAGSFRQRMGIVRSYDMLDEGASAFTMPVHVAAQLWDAATHDPSLPAEPVVFGAEDAQPETPGRGPFHRHAPFDSSGSSSHTGLAGGSSGSARDSEQGAATSGHGPMTSTPVGKAGPRGSRRGAGENGEDMAQAQQAPAIGEKQRADGEHVVGQRGPQGKQDEEKEDCEGQQEESSKPEEEEAETVKSALPDVGGVDPVHDDDDSGDDAASDVDGVDDRSAPFAADTGIDAGSEAPPLHHLVPPPLSNHDVATTECTLYAHKVEHMLFLCVGAAGQPHEVWHRMMTYLRPQLEEVNRELLLNFDTKEVPASPSATAGDAATKLVELDGILNTLDTELDKAMLQHPVYGMLRKGMVPEKYFATDLMWARQTLLTDEESVSEAVLQRGPFTVYGNKTFAQETYLQVSDQARNQRGGARGAGDTSGGSGSTSAGGSSKGGYRLTRGIFDQPLTQIAASAHAQVQAKSGKLLM